MFNLSYSGIYCWNVLLPNSKYWIIISKARFISFRLKIYMYCYLFLFTLCHCVFEIFTPKSQAIKIFDWIFKNQIVLWIFYVIVSKSVKKDLFLHSLIVCHVIVRELANLGMLAPSAWSLRDCSLWRSKKLGMNTAAIFFLWVMACRPCCT